jgi:hypothetical protein
MNKKKKGFSGFFEDLLGPPRGSVSVPRVSFRRVGASDVTRQRHTRQSSAPRYRRGQPPRLFLGTSAPSRVNRPLSEMMIICRAPPKGRAPSPWRPPRPTSRRNPQKTSMGLPFDTSAEERLQFPPVQTPLEMPILLVGHRASGSGRTANCPIEPCPSESFGQP